MLDNKSQLKEKSYFNLDQKLPEANANRSQLSTRTYRIKYSNMTITVLVTTLLFLI